MAVDISVERLIQREPAAVAGFALDPRNDTAWIAGIAEARLLGEPPLRQGSRVARVAQFLGKRIEYVNEVVALEPPHRLVMRSVAGPFPMTITYAFDAAPGGTRARIRVQGDAAGFYRLATPLLAAMVRRSVARDLRALQRLMEASATASVPAPSR